MILKPYYLFLLRSNPTFFLVKKGGFFLAKLGVRMLLGVRKRGGAQGVLLARGRQSFRSIFEASNQVLSGLRGARVW